MKTDPNISKHIFHTVLHTIPEVLWFAGDNVWKNKMLFTLWDQRVE